MGEIRIGAVLRPFANADAGVIAGTDLLLYLDLNKQRCRTKFFEEVQDSNGIIEREQYLKYVHKMRRDYLPLIPHFGMRDGFW